MHKKILGSGHNTTLIILIILNDEMEDFFKIVKSLEDSELLFEGVSETIKTEAKEQKRGFLSMLLGTLGSSLLRNMLAGRGVVRTGGGRIRVGYGSKRSSFKKELIPPHSLINFEIQKYYQSEPRFNGVYSRDNLHDKVKYGPYVINLDQHSDLGTHWIALYILNNEVIYFDSFGVEHIPKEIKNFIRGSIDKFTIVTNIFRIQAYDSVMCGCFCVVFIDFMLKGKSLTDFTNLFSPNYFKKNDDIILCFFFANL